MWFVVKQSRSRLNLTVGTALLGSMCLHFGTALHCTLINSLRITEMHEDEELHNILQCLQNQTEQIENLFVDDNVPLATEDFSRFYVQNLMSRDLNVTSTKQPKKETMSAEGFQEIMKPSSSNFGKKCRIPEIECAFKTDKKEDKVKNAKR